MAISRQDLASVIGEKTLSITDANKLATTIAAYLLEEQRTSELESLIRDIMQYRLDHGIVEAKVVSAHDLPSEIVNDVKLILNQEFPKATRIDIDTELDPAVVGGIRIELPNEQLDMTIEAKLDTFKRLTTGGAV